VLEQAGLTVHEDAPWTEDDQTVGQSLLTPTRIYVNEVLKLHEDVRHCCEMTAACVHYEF
jgi:phosphoribosylaminoimidazole (AIR) synthetase